MKKVRTYNTIATIGLEQFPRDSYEVASEITHPDAIVLRSHNLLNEVFPETLQCIARAGAGTNNVPVQRCSEQGIVVFNTPGANANAVKELVLAGLLLSSRGIVQGMNYIRGMQGELDDSALAKEMEAQKKRFKGTELAGKTLGVVGLGAIGSLVANMAISLGMKVAGFDPAISIEAAWRLSSEVEKMDNLSSLLSRSDFVSLHVPAIDATHHLINKDSLASARPGVVILNFAREQIVDVDAIVTAMEQGKVGKYVTDFPVQALLHNENAILMPHIGASTREAEENCAVMAANQVREFLEHGNIRNSVNFPPADLPRTTDFRLTFTNENVSGVLGNVLSILADASLNVVDMLNKSRENLAYNILDLEETPSQAVLDKIQSVEHVVNVRVL
ncbi:MAG: 3-phosphoglycerate dehydrogenase [Oleiphilus sp.]|nr:MAG: 3-phosphoglycerate dehydrogenase [Oleiphilus sp.]